VKRKTKTTALARSVARKPRPGSVAPESIARLVRAEVVADNLGLTVGTIKRMARAGVIPVVRVSQRGDMRFDLNEVRIRIENASNKRSA
jgi:hypothetical protein